MNLAQMKLVFVMQFVFIRKEYTHTYVFRHVFTYRQNFNFTVSR